MLKFEMTVPVKKAGSFAGPPFSMEFLEFFWKNNRPAADYDALRRKIACTGVGYLATLRQRPALALTH